MQRTGRPCSSTIKYTGPNDSSPVEAGDNSLLDLAPAKCTVETRLRNALQWRLGPHQPGGRVNRGAPSAPGQADPSAKTGAAPGDLLPWRRFHPFPCDAPYPRREPASNRGFGPHRSCLSPVSPERPEHFPPHADIFLGYQQPAPPTVDKVENILQNGNLLRWKSVKYRGFQSGNPRCIKGF